MAGMCVGIAALVGGALLLIAAGESYTCGGYQQATGKETKYTRLECYIKDGGQWYSWEEYKHRLVARGQMKPE